MLPSLYIRLISCLKQSIQEATLSENSSAVTWFDSLRRSFMGGAVHLRFSTQVLMHAFGKISLCSLSSSSILVLELLGGLATQLLSGS